MRKAFASILFAIVAVRGLLAAEVNCAVAGRLAEALGNAGETVSLTVTGEIDAADFMALGECSPSLRQLDLSSVSIKEYNGAMLPSGRYSSPAGCIPSFALFGSSIESIVLPERLTSIGDYAFAASNLTSVKIPSGVSSVGEGAFKDCSALMSVDMECCLDSFPAMLFDGCVLLSDVLLLHEIGQIGCRAFAGCCSLKSFPAVKSVARIGEEAFAGSGLTVVDFSENAALESIGQRAFAMCESLESVNIPECVTAIPEYAFFCDSSIVDFGLSGSSVARIGDFSLAGCSSVESLALPETLSRIDGNAMEGMLSLREIDASKLSCVPELGSDVWTGIRQEAVDMTVAPAMLQEFVSAPQWKEFNILSMSAVESLPADSPYRGIEIFFDGCNLIVRSSDDRSIEKMSLFDLSGSVIYCSDSGRQSVEIDTSRWSSPVFVVTLWLSGADSPLSVKIIRQ